jgi:AbrB family looped-hinge helix DNA binding protein
MREKKYQGAANESAMTKAGRLTIPKAIREHLGLESGDRVKLAIYSDGSVRLLPKRGSKAKHAAREKQLCKQA